MRRDNTPWRPVQAAAVDWTEDENPLSRKFGDVYYSACDGLEESRYVFLAGNRLPARWRENADSTFCIAETGFGTGLNFLLTWQAWRKQGESAPDLHYISVEKYPLTREDLARALAAWPELQGLSADLQRAWPGLVPGQHRLLFEGGRVRLDLWWEDACEAFTDLACHGPLVDAWYLDGFAPSRNDAMWQPQLFDAVAALSRRAATFATFTAAGHVRRGLSGCGFAVEKAPGFGRKRECLRGTLAGPAPAVASGETPWDLHANPAARPASVLVLGGGIAGCSTAAALARRGLAVTLLERDQLAGAASGNEQGILYTRLSRRHSTLTDFALQSFRFSSEFYRQLFATGLLQVGRDGELCGSFHQNGNDGVLDALEAVLAPVPELARVLDPAAASEILGLAQAGRGLWFPGSGWMHPPAICRALAAGKGIRIREHCGQAILTRENGQWLAHTGEEILAHADCAVITTGTGATLQPGLDWLPLQAIRGQTTQLPSTGLLRDLRTALCHEGYISPAREGEHCIGATFSLQDQDDALRPGDHRENLDTLARALPTLAETLSEVECNNLHGRVGYRCASPDYLPLVGPVPDREGFLDSYAGLRKNARQVINHRGNFVPGLYLSSGHGSRGLTSAPLAAELLASQICGEAPPLSRVLCRALAPARFIMRDLARNRV